MALPAGRYNATIYPEKSGIFGLHHQQLFAERDRNRQRRVSLDDVEAALLRDDRVAYRIAAA